MPTNLVSYTCPMCKMTSYNPNDVKYMYCGNCHTYEEDGAMDIVVDNDGPGRKPVINAQRCNTREELRLLVRHAALEWYQVLNEVKRTTGLVETDAKWIVKVWFDYWIDQCFQQGWWRNWSRRRQVRKIIRDSRVA